jgi:hypothetical protein
MEKVSSQEILAKEGRGNYDLRNKRCGSAKDAQNYHRKQAKLQRLQDPSEMNGMI